MADKQVGWIITKAHGDDLTRNIGYGQVIADAGATQASFDAVIGRTIFMTHDLSADDIPADKRVKWRSFSDDGDASYDGVVHYDWLMGEVVGVEEDEDLAYNIDRFVMNDVGDTVVVYNAKDMIRCDESRREWIENHPRMERKAWLAQAGIDPQAWLAIYG